MKKTKTIAWVLLTVGALQFLTSCFGKFALVGKVYKFNDGIMGNDLLGRFVKTLLMYAMFIVPVYGLAFLVDFYILNLIEFWTGKNLLAMKAGESETQFVTFHGKKFKMVGEQNKMTITELGINKTTVLYFDANTAAVSVLKDGQMVKVGDYKIEPRNFASMQQFNGSM